MDNRIIDKDVIFEKLSDDHRTSVIDIFNFYIENDFSAYPEKNLNMITMTIFYPYQKTIPHLQLK